MTRLNERSMFSSATISGMRFVRGYVTKQAEVFSSTCPNNSSNVLTAFLSCGECVCNSPRVVNVVFRLSIISIYAVAEALIPRSMFVAVLVPRQSPPIKYHTRISAAHRSSCSSSKKRCSRSHRRDRCSHSSCCQTAEHSGAWDFLPFVPLLT